MTPTEARDRLIEDLQRAGVVAEPIDDTEIGVQLETGEQSFDLFVLTVEAA